MYISKRKHYLLNKELARKIILDRVVHFAGMYRVHLKRVAIRNQKTRWGSCSKNGNLNFNYKILFLPSALLDYVVVHEICHLLEFNHSAEFWSHVARTISDYKTVRSQLRKVNLTKLGN